MLDNKLIESALSLTYKTMDYMTEIMPDGGGYEYQDDFCIEKFFYYILSKEFIEKYLDTVYQYAKITKPERMRIIAGRFGDAIFLYQSGNEKPLIELLNKICQTDQTM